ncbi:MAG: hypothetical protein OXU61_05665 [Gammaproteobacteria bacterium]|nr:hypothetical protein [Gammaproteobacteria bacterium]
MRWRRAARQRRRCGLPPGALLPRPLPGAASPDIARMRRVCSCAVSRPHPRSLSQREREAKEGRPLPPLPPGEGWGEGKIRGERSAG